MSAQVSSRSQDVDRLPGSAQPRWLDADEQKAWRAWLYSAQLLQDLLDRELTHETGIPHAYYEILVQLSEAPDRRLRMSQLADRCLSSRSRLSHAVSRLEERGWVRREVCPNDRRSFEAIPTDEGEAERERAWPIHAKAIADEFGRFFSDEEARELAALLERPLQVLEQGNCGP